MHMLAYVGVMGLAREAEVRERLVSEAPLPRPSLPARPPPLRLMSKAPGQHVPRGRSRLLLGGVGLLGLCAFPRPPPRTTQHGCPHTHRTPVLCVWAQKRPVRCGRGTEDTRTVRERVKKTPVLCGEEQKTPMLCWDAGYSRQLYCVGGHRRHRFWANQDIIMHFYIIVISLLGHFYLIITYYYKVSTSLLPSSKQ